MFKYFNTPTLKPANLVSLALWLLIVDYTISRFTNTSMTAINTIIFCLFIAFVESFHPSNKSKDIK